MTSLLRGGRRKTSALTYYDRITRIKGLDSGKGLEVHESHGADDAKGRSLMLRDLRDLRG